MKLTIDPLYLVAENSPEIPDGWVMVPKEPTESMIIDGFESEPDKYFSDKKRMGGISEYERVPAGCAPGEIVLERDVGCSP